jgi:transposase InsO family protein
MASAVNSFITIPAKIGSIRFNAILDTGSTINIMPECIAKQYNLKINTKKSINLDFAEGSTRTLGTVSFNLTIGSLTQTITAQIIRGFKYHLLLGKNIGKLFPILISLRNDTAILEYEAPTTKPKTLQQLSPKKSQQTLIAESYNPAKNFETQKKIRSQLTPDSKSKTALSLTVILTLFSTLFATTNTDLGRINTEKHRIRLTNDKPIALRPYRQSIADVNETDRQVKELLEKGLIRESTSPYAAPVTLADKKDGTKRLCMDYRSLNKNTISDKEPMPHIQDVIDRLYGAKYFAKLDVAWGYWHVAMHEEDIHKTAFVTQNGHYEWLVLPFGLKNAPAIFQRVIRKILADLINNGCMNYLDDIIIYAKTLEEHNRLLHEVFSRLKKHNVRLRREKCEFAVNSIEFLGHVIADSKVRPPSSKVKAVLDFPRPESYKEIQRFHGLANYLREYINNFSIIAAPLTRLLRKDTQFIWSDEQEDAFEQIKAAMANEPVRKIFDPNLKCELHTDASTVGIGAILIQDSHPIGYFSRRLSDAETRYTPTELECMAVVNAIEYFRIYLEGTHLTVVTDHSALQWLLKFSNTKRRLFRWSKDLSIYDFNVIHRAGKNMEHVNDLSRAPVNSQIRSASDINLLVSSDNLIKAQLRSDCKPIGRQFIKDGILSIKIRGVSRQVIPKPMISTVLKSCHDESGHPGYKKCIRQISQSYWWPQMYSDIRTYCKTCHTCQIIKPSTHPNYGQLQPLPTPTKPMEFIAMDTIVMGTSAKATKAKYIQVVIDHHSRYVWAKATPTNTAQAVVGVLENIFHNVGVPERILTDNGTNFTSRVFRKFLKDNNVRTSYTTTYHPQTNGTNEKVNDTLVKGLRMAISESPKLKWSTLLSRVVDNYNNTIHSTTGFTPSYLLFGKDTCNTRLPLDEARRLAYQRSEDFKARKKEAYDRSHKPLNLKPGDLVKRRIPSNHPNNTKLTPKFDAVYKVVSQLSPVNYEIIKQGDNPASFNIHVSQLEPYYQREPNLLDPGE